MRNQALNNQFADKQLKELAQVLVASTPYAPPPSSRFTAELRQQLMAAYDEPVGWQFVWLPALLKTAVSFAAILLLLVAGWHYFGGTLAPDPEPMAEPSLVNPTNAPEATATTAPTATAVSADEIPVVGGPGSVDSVIITAVVPSTGTLTQTTTFTVTLDYQLHSHDSATIEVKLTEASGMGMRGIYRQELPISSSEGTLTTTLTFRPGDVTGPATIRLRAEIKTDPRVIPLAIDVSRHQWEYQPPE
jgi:hypothetical protein